MPFISNWAIFGSEQLTVVYVARSKSCAIMVILFFNRMELAICC